MAQRNTRKGRGKTKYRPELRTGGGERAKADRRAQRERAQERSAHGNVPLVRMRPAGAAGALAMFLIGWLGVAILALVALRLGRWNVLSYPDSLWLYASLGAVAVAVAVGRVSRSARDADSWGAQALLVPAALLAVEAIVGPACPTGGDCAAIGARGGMGLPLSFLLVVACAAAAWGLARWQQRAGARARHGRGRTRYATLVATMFWLFVFPGAVLGASFVGLDAWVRDTPQIAASAIREAERSCYGLTTAPDLSVRAAPNGYSPSWTTFAVRRTDESRPGVGGKPLPSNWATLDEVHPYEATVSFNAGGDLVSVSCRKLGPGTGNATADDLKQDEPESNPLSPKTGAGSQFYPRFFTQGVAGPTEAAKEAAEAEPAAKGEDEG